MADETNEIRDIGKMTSKNETRQQKNMKQNTLDAYLEKPISETDAKNNKCESNDGKPELNHEDKSSIKPTDKPLIKPLVDYDSTEDSNEESEQVKNGDESIKMVTENECKIQTDYKSKNVDDSQESEMSMEEGEIKSEPESKNFNNVGKTDKIKDLTVAHKRQKDNKRGEFDDNGESCSEEELSSQYNDRKKHSDTVSKNSYGDTKKSKDSHKRKWRSSNNTSASSEDEFKRPTKKKIKREDCSNERKFTDHSYKEKSKTYSKYDGTSDDTDSPGSSPEKGKTQAKYPHTNKYTDQREERHSKNQKRSVTRYDSSSESSPEKQKTSAKSHNAKTYTDTRNDTKNKYEKRSVTGYDSSSGSSQEKEKTSAKSQYSKPYPDKREENRNKYENKHITDYETAKMQFEFFFGMKSPFSQFHPANFKLEDITFSCAEQYMMYQKAVLFKDIQIGNQILQETKPLKMKRLGRKVRNFDPHIWGKVCTDIVVKGNIAKFSQNPYLEKELIDTYPKILAESSPRDCLWGIGLGATNVKAWNVNTWRGQNLLGKALMNVRTILMKRKGFKI